MKPDSRPCPMCGDRLETPMRIEVCGACFQELRTSGALALNTTAEFAAVRPGQGSEPARVRHARARTPEGEVACTWCGKLRSEVKKLLASGDARICNECVALCADVLEAELGAEWR